MPRMTLKSSNYTKPGNSTQITCNQKKPVMAEQEPQQAEVDERPPFLSLPAEMRLEIYSFLFDGIKSHILSPNEVDRYRLPHHWPSSNNFSGLTSLLLTCKHVYNESNVEFYQNFSDNIVFYFDNVYDLFRASKLVTKLPCNATTLDIKFCLRTVCNLAFNAAGDVFPYSEPPSDGFRSTDAVRDSERFNISSGSISSQTGSVLTDVTDRRRINRDTLDFMEKFTDMPVDPMYLHEYGLFDPTASQPPAGGGTCIHCGTRVVLKGQGKATIRSVHYKIEPCFGDLDVTSYDIKGRSGSRYVVMNGSFRGIGVEGSMPEGSKMKAANPIPLLSGAKSISKLRVALGLQESA